MTQDELKTLVGQAALQYVTPDTVVGVGTGSTVDKFIDALAASGVRIAGAVSSSVRSTERMKALGIPVLDASEVESLQVYIDGADEIDRQGHMIKGGGAALTREKIIAAASQKFVCMIDPAKRVDVLGKFPLPAEVIPVAGAQIARRLRALGGDTSMRQGLVTDNGCHIIDVRGLTIDDPPMLEREINQWPGVVTVGIFARNRASVCLLGTSQGVRTLTF